MLTDNAKSRNRLIRNTLSAFPTEGDALKALPEHMRTDMLDYIFDAIIDRSWFDAPLAERDKLSPVMTVLGQSREGDPSPRVLDAYKQAAQDYDVDLMEALLAFDIRAVNHASARDRIVGCGPWVRPMLRLYNEGDVTPGVYIVMLFRATPSELRDALVAKILRFCDELGFSYDMLRQIARAEADFLEIVNTLAPADAPVLTEH
jgi:hypothetical protein